MAVVESQVAAAELEKVTKKLRKLFEQDYDFWGEVKKRGDVEKVSNRSMRIPLEIRPGGKFQYFNPDGGDLGRGGGPQLDKAVVNCVFVSENIEYTKLVQWSTDSEQKSIVNAVRRLSAFAFDELQRQLDSQLMQDGSGQVGTISAVATASGVDTYTLDTDGFGARLVRFEQTVQVFDTTLATLRGKGVITKHDVDGKVIDVTPAIAGAVATDKLVVDGISAPASIPALLGVKYHHSNASSGNWLGFSRAATPEIRANRVNAASAALSLPLPRLAMYKRGNRTGKKASGSGLKAWMNPAQMAAYEDIGQAVIVINNGGKGGDLDMYFGENMRLAGAPARPHYNWDKTRIDFVDVGATWGRAEILPLGFYKTDGRNIFEIRGASGGVAAADIFYLVWGGQTFVTNPQDISYIDNLAVPAGY